MKKIAALLLGLILAIAIPTAAHATTPPVLVTYAGDSTTAQSNSWLTHIHAPDFTRVPGYYHSGYRTDQVLAVIPPAPDADVLVIMLGINDLHYADYNDMPSIIDRINQIAVKVGAKHVILCATAPSNITSYSEIGTGRIIDPQTAQTKLNALIKADALVMGYTYKDPFSSIRSSATGGYHAADETSDGTHPSTSGYVIVAQELAPVMQAVAAS